MSDNTQTKQLTPQMPQLTGTLSLYHYEYIDKEIFDTMLNEKRITREPKEVIDAIYEIPIMSPNIHEFDLFRHKMITDFKFKRIYNALLKATYNEDDIFNKDEINQNTTALIFSMLIYQENPDYNLVLDLLKDLMQEKYHQYFYDQMFI